MAIAVWGREMEINGIKVKIKFNKIFPAKQKYSTILSSRFFFFKKKTCHL